MDPHLPPDRLAAIQDALRKRRKIEAVKIYREATGVSLKEAKDAVEAMPVPKDLPPASGPASAPGTRTPLPGWNEAPKERKGCFALVAALATAAAVVWRLL